MPRGQAKLLDCLLCRSQHSRQSVDKGGYFVESGICKDCYVKMQQSPVKISCFGKLPVGNSYGYGKNSLVCSQVCPDRYACKIFVSKLSH